MGHTIASAEVDQRKVLQKNSEKVTETSRRVPGQTVDHDFLNCEMNWLESLINLRCEALFSDAENMAAPTSKVLELPKAGGNSPYELIVNTHGLSEMDRVILALGVASANYPSLLKLFVQIEDSSSLAIEAGGEYNKANRTFKPTFQTALFLLSGNNLSLWSHYSTQLIQGSALLENDIIYNRSSTEFIHGKIELDTAYLNYFLSGKKPRLDHGPYFPGTLYESDLTLDDIILEDNVRTQINPIGHYIKALESGFFKNGSHRFKPGFIALFYGAPGTGKTMLAGILANTYGIEMYHVDLSQAVSKYIGETEKNLEVIFNRLQGKNCMLFFDEADALFGKRSDVKDAHDRYANQEVSYLLQRIEKFDGLTILASNFENNMDDAFKRRIDLYINVVRPSESTKKSLWNHYLPKNIAFESDMLLNHLSREYAYTGSNIRNIMKNVAIALACLEQDTITHDLISPYLVIENAKAFGINQSRVNTFIRNSETAEK